VRLQPSVPDAVGDQLAQQQPGVIEDGLVHVEIEPAERRSRPARCVECRPQPQVEHRWPSREAPQPMLAQAPPVPLAGLPLGQPLHPPDPPGPPLHEPGMPGSRGEPPGLVHVVPDHEQMQLAMRSEAAGAGEHRRVPAELAPEPAHVAERDDGSPALRIQPVHRPERPVEIATQRRGQR
jgi:hypothetical protein